MHQYTTGVRFSPRRLLNIVLFSFLVYCVFIETELSLFNKSKGDNDKFVDKFLHPMESTDNNELSTTYTEEETQILGTTSPSASSSNTTTSSTHHHHQHHHGNVGGKDDDALPVPGKPTYIIIVTEWRSGSSFFGDLFNYRMVLKKCHRNGQKWPWNYPEINKYIKIISAP